MGVGGAGVGMKIKLAAGEIVGMVSGTLCCHGSHRVELSSRKLVVFNIDRWSEVG